jgi:low molecular weight protein-tyrosine phosphatase
LPPFTVLHVCVGNICRSPMAERLFTLALRKQVGDRVDQLYLSHGAGTGSWHAGDPMNPPAARQVTLRGGDPAGFRARKVTGDLIDASDLVLCATAEQVSYVLGLRPDAEARTFVLGEFGRLLADVKLRDSDGVLDERSAYARGVALVEAVDAARGGDVGERESPRRSDDLDDPYGMPDREFARVADEIELTVVPLAQALTR